WEPSRRLALACRFGRRLPAIRRSTGRLLRLRRRLQSLRWTTLTLRWALREGEAWRTVTGRTLPNPKKLTPVLHRNLTGICLELMVREIVSPKNGQALIHIEQIGALKPFSVERVLHTGGGLPPHYDSSLSAACALRDGVICRTSQVQDAASLRLHEGSIMLQRGRLTLDQSKFHQRWKKFGAHCLVRPQYDCETG
ncbi:unnamed protein product, partial [Polarella glacialis]